MWHKRSTHRIPQEKWTSSLTPPPTSNPDRTELYPLFTGICFNEFHKQHKEVFKIGAQSTLTSSLFKSPYGPGPALNKHLPNAAEPHHLLIYFLHNRTFKSFLCDTVWSPGKTWAPDGR
ncbi:hypothetical protein ATANTOWER_025723 [Ataeniobius toweri]|uniref:Uncharacterized protein n=1 Tax=Ataeniobius toweri TaxID=208326 RepID=A0ABU7BMP4_9TELE|nr:hypothetical protein [Ataeniobius toweri]